MQVVPVTDCEAISRALSTVTAEDAKHILMSHKCYGIYCDATLVSVTMVRECNDCTGCFEVYYMGTMPEYRRRGYARALMNYLIAQQKKIWVMVEPDNVAAVQLLKDMRFLFGSYVQHKQQWVYVPGSPGPLYQEQ